MVLIQKHRIGEFSFIQIFTQQNILLLDYHASLYGKNHAQPSFNAPPKPVRFLVKVIEHIDCLFVTSAESLGCLFVDSSVRVYCTKPVYDQLLLKYEEYLNLLVTYEEGAEGLARECCKPADTGRGGCRRTDSTKTSGKFKVVSIEDIDIESTKKNIHFIKYNEPIALDTVSVNAVASGTFLGWANYKLSFQTGDSLYYLTSYSPKNRFSSQAEPIDSTYIIFNRKEISPRNDLNSFSAFLYEFCKGDASNTLLITLPIQTLFIEILLHTLSVIHPFNTPVYVVSPQFKKIELLVNIQSEWLNTAYSRVAEPFPIRDYKRLHQLSMLNHDYSESKKIIFCSDIFYRFKNKNRLFTDQVDILINFDQHKNTQEFNGSPGHATHSFKNEPAGNAPVSSEPVADTRINSVTADNTYAFNIKMEASREEILATTKAIPIEDNYFFINTTPESFTIKIDGNQNLIEKNLFLSGKFL